MPRTSRQVSSTGYYHVMLRGNGRQILFESDRDRMKLLEYLDKSLSESNVELLAWCLMDNHFHLLISDPDFELSSFVKRIATGYAVYHNRKEGHVGHVFQSRFRSEAIECDGHLLEVLRYIHNNPEEAGLCRAEEYPWSSYQEYLGCPMRTNTELFLDMLGGAEGFRAFCADKRVRYPQDILGRELTSEQLIEFAQGVLETDNVSFVKSLRRKDRDPLLRKLWNAGLSVRQIERATGVGRNTVMRALS